ncbi:tRNA dimethylallyltransferase [Companilactobacillus sp. RD055328]|uniref:tRNA (adenosine(37)-N6)-dimethylallyltransferase MiaA n=1 Tax=Companilactobacillus sp. RD055328 TaxID=2916634 RepID=UPI001FC7BE48|nr:tRNA (adenosine(37)-N6)-dimethylallyltransferase MiaA [Companilactobacillus sp. RD055328]GKQ42541.1 tRNA dimethylallyltransferase [Companilactobacillus sp. RD055328]
MKKNKAIIILGPTAIGKSSLGIKLAQKYNGEIISGDSMQVYRNLDIGTAKVTIDEQQLVKHHLIDITDVTKRYTVKDFQEQSEKLIEQINSSGKIPIIVGGTGFYLNALVQGMNLGGEGESSQELRFKLEQYSLEWLMNKLKEVDPETAKTIDSNNKRRIIRAIEVFEQTGNKISDQEDSINDKNEFLIVGLTDNRESIYERINNRVEDMFSEGLEEEARQLYEIKETVPQAKTGIGYKELFGYFDGEYDLTEAKRLIQRNTRHFAKRQLTYFRNQMKVNWVEISDDKFSQNIEEIINKFIK